MFIVATAKPGEYDAEPGDGLRPVETYQYLFYGELKAVFTVCEVVGEGARVSIIDAGDPSCVNAVPIKFYDAFDTVDDARAELDQLITFGSIDARLEAA